MTTKLYDEYPYETKFTAKITSCSESAEGCLDMILDRTLFFPEEGGQSPDKGTVTVCGIPLSVHDVQIDKSGFIHHYINAGNITPDIKNNPEDTSVTGLIDWRHRFSNMQQHSGEHIFSGIVNKRFGYNNVGFHLSDNEVTMDYDGLLNIEQIHELEYAANQAIIENHPVKCFYPSPAELESINYRSKSGIKGAVRIVQIEGVDTCACCAPHVRSTAEVGLLKVVSSQSWKGGVRLSILCGFRALAEFNRLEEAAAFISHEYSVPVSKEAFKEAIEKRNQSCAELKIRHNSLQEKLLLMQADNFINTTSSGNACSDTPGSAISRTKGCNDDSAGNLPGSLPPGDVCSDNPGSAISRTKSCNDDSAGNLPGSLPPGDVQTADKAFSFGNNACSRNILLFTEDTDDVVKRNVLNRLSKTHKGYCCIFDGNDDKGYSFIIASSDSNCNELIKTLKSEFETRGGGKPVMVQGFVKARRVALMALLS